MKSMVLQWAPSGLYRRYNKILETLFLGNRNISGHPNYRNGGNRLK